jgi:hypothetical protein
MIVFAPDMLPPEFQSSPVRSLHVRLIPRTPHGTTVRAHLFLQNGGTWQMCNTPPTKDPKLALSLLRALSQMARENGWTFHTTGDLVRYGGPRRPAKAG